MKFNFLALDSSGQELKDPIEAESDIEATKKIREMGYFVTQISEAKEPMPVSRGVPKIKFEISIISLCLWGGFAIGLTVGFLLGFIIFYTSA